MVRNCVKVLWALYFPLLVLLCGDLHGASEDNPSPPPTTESCENFRPWAEEHCTCDGDERGTWVEFGDSLFNFWSFFPCPVHGDIPEEESDPEDAENSEADDQQEHVAEPVVELSQTTTTTLAAITQAYGAFDHVVRQVDNSMQTNITAQPVTSSLHDTLVQQRAEFDEAQRNFIATLMRAYANIAAAASAQ